VHFRGVDNKAIALCATYFRANNSYQLCKEAYVKLSDFASLIQLHVEHQKWDEAFQILEQHPQFTVDVFLPYATFLAENDRYDEAQLAFKKANKPLEALKMITHLASNAVSERRFETASFYLWQCVHETMLFLKDEKTADADSDATAQQVATIHSKFSLAKIYHAYNLLHKYNVSI